MTTNHAVTAAAARTLWAHWEADAPASGLAISGFSMMQPTGGGFARSGGGQTAGVLSFEAETGSVYELQWTPALGGEWIPPRRWTAETGGETGVPVPATPGEATGFFRLASPAE